MMRLNVEADQNHCLRCGAHVTPEFRRGYGDGRDRAHRCPDCDTYTRLSSGSAAGLEIETADPLDDPTRFNECYSDLPSHVQQACLGQPNEIATDGGEER